MNKSKTFEFNIDSNMVSLIETLGFSKGLQIPLKIVKDLEKFLDFILPKDKAFLLVVPKEYMDSIKIVNKIRNECSKYVFISESLRDSILLFT